MVCRTFAIAAVSILVCSGSGGVLAQDGKLTLNDWPWWRGPHRNGVAADNQSPPTKWDERTNVVWKADVPGRGHSSPVVVGGRVLLSTADERGQVQTVLCFDRKTGKQLWTIDVNKGDLPRRIHRKNTHASPTLACDGERVLASFNNKDGIQLAALSLEGKLLWQKKAGDFRPRAYQYGYAASPLLYKTMVIVAADVEGTGSIAAFDRSSGKEIWRTRRSGVLSYSSPTIGKVAGKEQLLISGGQVVAGYNPMTGKLLWTGASPSQVTCGTVVWEGNLVFSSGGYPRSGTIAVRGDGSGRVVWQNRQRCYEQSMLAHKGFVYAVADNGGAFCWRAADGKEAWSARLQGPVSASPILAGGNVYLSTERGTTFVFRADPAKFTLVAKNQLGNEAFATPAICGDQIFLRVASTASGSRQESLYCLGKK